MPQVLRWPEFRTEPVPYRVDKLLRLMSIVDHPSISGRNLRQFALDAFTHSFKKSEAQALCVALIQKDKMFSRRLELKEKQKTDKNKLEFS